MSPEEAHAQCEPEWERCLPVGERAARSLGITVRAAHEICDALYWRCRHALEEGERFDWHEELRRNLTRAGRREMERGQDRSNRITVYVPIGPFMLTITISGINTPRTVDAGLLGGYSKEGSSFSLCQ